MDLTLYAHTVDETLICLANLRGMIRAKRMREGRLTAYENDLLHVAWNLSDLFNTRLAQRLHPDKEATVI